MPREGTSVQAPVLRSRPLAALLTAEVLSTTGSQMTWLALPWFVLVTTGSAKQMTLVIAAEAGGYALFGIPSGSLLERLGPQRTMRLCDAVRAPLMLLAPVPAAAVAGALALSGIANGLVNPTLHAFLTLRPPAA